MVERDYIRLPMPSRIEERTDVEKHLTEAGFTRCANPKGQQTYLYFWKLRSDEAWVVADKDGVIAVNWPYDRLLQEFAATKGIYWNKTAVIPGAVYDVEIGLPSHEAKTLLSEWQEFRRQRSREALAEITAANH